MAERKPRSRGRTVVANGRRERDERLLDRLEDLYLREGFRGVGVGELAARLRCSRRTLYELAPSKESLFLLVLDRFLARIRTLGQERVEAERDLARRIEALLEPGITETRRASEAFSADVAAFAPARQLMDDHQRRRMEMLREVVEEGSRRGIFRGVHSLLVAEVMLAAVGRVRQPDFLHASKMSMSQAFAECSHLLRHGLLHAEPPAKRTKPRARA